jgi:hypothetical protein
MIEIFFPEQCLLFLRLQMHQRSNEDENNLGSFLKLKPLF